MDRGYLTPALGRLYTEEVRHLHSLWHRGPPPSPNTNPSLRPGACTAFKKEAKNKKKSKSKWKRKRQQQSSAGASGQPPANPPAKEVEWPCNPTPEQNAPPDAWADLAPLPAAAQPRPPASAEEQARALADRAQQSGLKACEDFFSKKDDSDEGEEEEESMDEDEESGEVVFKFLLGLFERDGKLREYYEKNWEKGEFSCLVCWGIGVKKWKRFGDCVGLMQHSNSISKTKRRDAHRAFARAVCRVLGWDINRLPSIVLDLGTSLGQSLTQAANAQENLQREGEIGEKENDEDLVDCRETTAITELMDRDVIDNKENYPEETGDCGEVKVGTQ